MAKVKALSLQIVKALKRKIDFYYWKGIPVARKWPDWSHFKPSKKQEETMQWMRDANRKLKELSPKVVDLWRAQQRGTRASWIDAFRYLYFGYRKQGINEPPVLVDYSITETETSYIIEPSFASLQPTHYILAKGFSPYKYFTRSKKGRKEKCPRPPHPVNPTPPRPSPPSTGAEMDFEITHSVQFGSYEAYGGSNESWGDACQQAWEQIPRDVRRWGGGNMGVGVELRGTHYFDQPEPEYPPFEWWDVYIAAKWNAFDVGLDDWYREHPGRDPDYLQIEFYIYPYNAPYGMCIIQQASDEFPFGAFDAPEVEFEPEPGYHCVKLEIAPRWIEHNRIKFAFLPDPTVFDWTPPEPPPNQQRSYGWALEARTPIIWGKICLKGGIKTEISKDEVGQGYDYLSYLYENKPTVMPFIPIQT